MLEGLDSAPQAVHAAWVISAAGIFNPPVYPEVEGLAEFAGKSWHSAQWPDNADLTGKRVVAHGLSREDMNGVHGMPLSFDSSTGRYAVRLEPDGTKFKLKPVNLRLDLPKVLRRATVLSPLNALRGVITEATDPDVEADPQAYSDAQARLAKLATEELVAVKAELAATVRAATATCMHSPLTVSVTTQP